MHSLDNPLPDLPGAPALPAADKHDVRGGVTATNSTVDCAGSFSQQTVTTDTTFGPANICIGPEKSVGFFVCAGALNVNTNTDTIIAGVAIPTLSVWALCTLAVALGALALRHLRRLRPTQG